MNKEGVSVKGTIVVPGRWHAFEPPRELERAARPVLGARLHLPGFLNQSEIGRAYAAAVAPVLLSVKWAGETWGLVVNAAMQCSLPAMVRDGVGCHANLVVEGWNGFVFPSGEAGGLAEALQVFLRLPASERDVFGEQARQQMAAFSQGEAAEGLAWVIRAAVALPT